MKWLLDTNVVSETIVPRPNRNVIDWVAQQPPTLVAISDVTLAELEAGVSYNQHPDHRDELDRWIREQVHTSFSNRILPISVDILIEWLGLIRALSARRQTRGPADLLIASTARVHNLTLVTRNTRDFANTGITVYNPWTNETHIMEVP